MVTTTSSIDPGAQATALATAYAHPAQALLDSQTKSAQAESSALSKLGSALSAFDAAVATLSGKKGLTQNTASFSGANVGTATATPSAQPGSYEFFVEQTAAAHQISFDDLPAVPVALGGPLVVQLADGSSFVVDLNVADGNNDGSISQAEIARAINQANGNQGKVSATVVNTGSQTKLVLTAGSTGVDSQITIDASGLADGALKDALSAMPVTLVAARNAKVWFGAQGTGTLMEQASNTFTSVPGVAMTFTQAQAAGDAPVTLNVAADKDATAANVQGFVDAYNTLKKVLDDLTKVGDASSGTQSAVFASDASVRALRSRLNQIVRQDFGGTSLIGLGVSADRNGNLLLDKTKLQSKLDADPELLDKVFGSASLTASSGLLGAMDTYMNNWLDTTNGQIARRQQTVQTQQRSLTARQTRLSDQYDLMYQRYLKQFSQLQTLTAQMEQTSSSLSASLVGN
ncbi:flagellar filament capping protein FliD [Ramlibacter sp. H39-3-26]|uniref:flagellar filament capping protein FliD n=1 Tax=Curvibacter soli TaxID=3031331 RepID=UPI0023DB83F5|nr:flagellar filament capping protein FliD [Ramlibacter sp. H39-3-26]MDF1484215.1 flagellar filament capping protein FliD [Ramlibacter sp. H39-3-26]